MRQSDSHRKETETGKNDLRLMRDQDHMEEVWAIMKPNVDKYIDGFLEDDISHGRTATVAFSSFLDDLVRKNDSYHDKYHEFFSQGSMEEYAEDTEGFKANAKRECDVIRKMLYSNGRKDWKMKFKACKSQELYDTFRASGKKPIWAADERQHMTTPIRLTQEKGEKLCLIC